jgi:glycosyltransferase involved in cell wall biosynthesis
MPNRIIVSVTNDLSTDQRVHKVCTSLQAFGFDVLLVGFLQADSKILDREYATSRFSMWFKKGPFFYAEFSVRLFLLLLFNKSDHLLSNDLDTLLPNYLVSKIKRNNLVFDSHEIFSDSPELINRPRVQRFWQGLESFLMPRVKHSYTVCQSLANHFNKKLNVEMKVVRNVPYKTTFDRLKHNNKTLIFQGNYNKGRGLDLAIRCLAYLPDFNLIIVGGGFEFLKDLSREIGVLDRVEFVGKVPFEHLRDYTKKASIGLLLEEPIGLSFSYSLPNKLFDYIHSDLKIIASPLKEVKSVVDKYKIGVLLNNRSPKDVAAQIELLYSTGFNNSDYELAKQELNWQKEEEVLASVFLPIKK